MSIKVLTWCWENSRATGGDLLTLLAIADHAGDDGKNAYPSVATLAKKARLTERHVQRVLRNLVSLGELEIKPQKGRRGANLYEIPMTRDPDKMSPDNMSPRQNDGVTSESQGVTSEASGGDVGVTRTKREPSMEPSLRDNSGAPALERGPSTAEWFERFYTAYPRHKDRRDAEKAFERALKRGADPERLIAQAGAYAECVKAEKTEARFVKLPATWLNKGSYEDEFTPSVNRAAVTNTNFKTEEYAHAF